MAFNHPESVLDMVYIGRTAPHQELCLDSEMDRSRDFAGMPTGNCAADIGRASKKPDGPGLAIFGAVLCLLFNAVGSGPRPGGHLVCELRRLDPW